MVPSMALYRVEVDVSLASEFLGPFAGGSDSLIRRSFAEFRTRFALLHFGDVTRKRVLTIRLGLEWRVKGEMG